jgi:tetratricopeptide (TPR) repeat protein
MAETLPSDSLPPGIDEARQAARSLARLGRFDEAIRCWHRVEDLAPFDAEPARMIAALALRKSRQTDDKGDDERVPTSSVGEGSPPAAISPPVAQESPSLVDRPKAPRPLVLTRRQQLEQEIAFRPHDEGNYLELAELHLAERRTYEAQRTLIRALEVCRDLKIVERLEDVNMLRAKEQVGLAEELAAAEKTQDVRDEVDRLREESYRLELEIFRNRCHRYPDDKRLKFQLGLRLKQVGDLREALEPLQAGLEFPEIRAAASLEIGEILQRHNQFPKALQCYRQAAQMAAGESSQQECRKRALYRAGVLAAAMTLSDTARGYFSELVKMAPDYRDVRTRLDKLGEISETA